MPKVSVVIPVYGVEKYIERCARSLFEQTLEDMEFIFVDDCTKDRSIHVLENLIKQYPSRVNQVQILHHAINRGISRARETGIQYASGEFIAHCDSDDWAEQNMYEVMYSAAIKDNLDFVKCYYCNTDGNCRYIQNICCEEKSNVANKDAISYLLYGRHWDSIWNTLVRRTIYTENDIHFTDNAMLEDFFLSVQLLFYANKIGVIDKVLYNYFYNPESICRVDSEDVMLRRSLQAWRNSMEIISFINYKYETDTFVNEMIMHKYLVRRMLIPTLRNSVNYATWRTVYAELGFKPLAVNSIGLKDKVQYFLAQTKLYPIYASLFKR